MCRSNILFLMAATAILQACSPRGQADLETTLQPGALSKDEKIAIALAGFSPDGAIKKDGGYIVESDIFLTAAALQRLKADTGAPSVRIAQTEQYRTTRLITRLPRVLAVAVDAGSSNPIFIAAANVAIARYNALGLRLKFKRVSSAADADIVIKGKGMGEPTAGSAFILGLSSGFPDTNGDPASPITLNNQYFNTAYKDTLFLGSVIAHEIGHTIGFRHTDYADRSYSCGRTSWYDFLKMFGIDMYNEGVSDVGAIHIGGTPSTPDAASWMLACVQTGSSRWFNANDRIALNAMYK
jgi:hypothetical protein